MPNTTDNDTDLDTILNKLRSDAARLREQASTLESALETSLSRAPGTDQDLSKQAALAAGTAPMPLAAIPVEAELPPPLPPQPLRMKIELALTHESLGTDSLVRAVGEPVGRVVETLRALRHEHKIHNVGSAEHPVWTWRIGDLTATPVLQQVVRKLISERPMTTRELVEATGARLPRVGGVIVALQRGQDRVLNLGTPAAGRWFIVGERAHEANLSNRPPIRRRRRSRGQKPEV